MTAQPVQAPAPICPAWCSLGEAGHARDLATGITHSKVVSWTLSRPEIARNGYPPPPPSPQAAGTQAPDAGIAGIAGIKYGQSQDEKPPDEFHAHRRVLRRVAIPAKRWPHPGNQEGCLDVAVTREDDFIPSGEPHPVVVTLGDTPLTPEEARAIVKRGALSDLIDWLQR